MEDNWKNYGFTDEMSIEVGGNWGRNCVWRDKNERWHEDCIGAKKKQGPTVMCWGMIGWQWKGPFYVWSAETDEEREEATREIAKLNLEAAIEEARLNAEWKASEQWRELKEVLVELENARKQRQAERNGGAKKKIPQTWRGKKYKIHKMTRGEGRGINAWRYVKHVARPILWPECHNQLMRNPNFILMEDNAPCHNAYYTTREREKEKVEKVDWPPNSPDFNPIEHIWTLLKRRILRRRGTERITSVGAMKAVLEEEWDRITIAEINLEILKLLDIMKRCLAVKGGNNYHA